MASSRRRDLFKTGGCRGTQRGCRGRHWWMSLVDDIHPTLVDVGDATVVAERILARFLTRSPVSTVSSRQRDCVQLTAHAIHIHTYDTEIFSTQIECAIKMCLSWSSTFHSPRHVVQKMRGSCMHKYFTAFKILCFSINFEMCSIIQISIIATTVSSIFFPPVSECMILLCSFLTRQLTAARVTLSFLTSIPTLPRF